MSKSFCQVEWLSDTSLVIEFGSRVVVHLSEDEARALVWVLLKSGVSVPASAAEAEYLWPVER